jgi:hypothetical protein
MRHHVQAAGTLAGALALAAGLTLLQAPDAHADEDYCNDMVGTSAEETLSSRGAAAALDQMGDQSYTRRLEDLPAHYLTCPLVTEAINAGAKQVVMRGSPSPWWRAFWRW